METNSHIKRFSRELQKTYDFFAADRKSPLFFDLLAMGLLRKLFNEDNINQQLQIIVKDRNGAVLRIHSMSLPTSK